MGKFLPLYEDRIPTLAQFPDKLIQAWMMITYPIQVPWTFPKS